jgi:hypothetical protein
MDAVSGLKTLEMPAPIRLLTAIFHPRKSAWLARQSSRAEHPAKLLSQKETELTNIVDGTMVMVYDS